MKIEKYKMFDQVCTFLGEDLDSEPCKQLKEQLQSCKDCEVFVDKIKRTVAIYKTADGCDEIPDDVCKKLFKKLNLDDLMDTEENDKK